MRSHVAENIYAPFVMLPSNIECDSGIAICAFLEAFSSMRIHSSSRSFCLLRSLHDSIISKCIKKIPNARIANQLTIAG